MWKTKKCKNCSREFHATQNRREFCSKKCFGEFYVGEKNASWKGGKKKAKCLGCGKPIQFFPSLNKIYCSKKCMNVHRIPKVGKDNPNWRGGGVNLICKACNKVFTTPKSRVGQVYCSKECFNTGEGDKGAARWQPGSRWGMSGTKSGKRADLGIYVRSAWEANYARYLKWMLSRGEIAAWDYEKKTFEFPVKKGTRFYTPDFRVKNNDGSIEYHEVKGWNHPKGKTALARMALYYPEVIVLLIDKIVYGQLRKSLGRVIPEWEGLS